MDPAALPKVLVQPEATHAERPAVDWRGKCQDLKALPHLEKLEEKKIMHFCLFYYWELSKDLCRSFFLPYLSAPCFSFTGATDCLAVSPLASPLSPISGP